MKAYRDWKPSEFDISGLNAPDKQDWLVAPVILTRDSRCFEESNYCTLRKQLDDTNSEDWAAMEFGHWASGWFKIIVVRPGSKAAQIAQEAESKLEDYPILDEDDWSQRETDAVLDMWDNMSMRERIRLCARFEGNIFAARRGIPPDRIEEYLRNEV